MPREQDHGYRGPALERRDPRHDHRPADRDVRMERRDLYRDLPSVTNRNFGPRQDLQRGGYAGVGPTARWRSDERIQEVLHERLTGADTIDASAVIVAVTDGKVTLNGWVPERWMKHDAEELAHRVGGVVDVENRIHVGGDPRSFGRPGEAVRSGNDQVGSGFSSSSRVNMDDRHLSDTGAQGFEDPPLGRGR